MSRSSHDRPADPRVSPSREDEVVRSVSEAIGGPLGDHAGQHPWWTPLRVVLLLAAVAMSLGIVAKAPCLPTAGDAADTGRYTDLCWSDTATTYVASGLAEGNWPFTADDQVRARYAPSWVTPLPAYVAFASQRITHVLSGSPDVDARALLPVSEVALDKDVRREARIFMLVNAVLLAGVGLLAAGLIAGVRRRRPWDAAAFALAPVLVLFFPITWELLPAAAVAAALWGWSRGRMKVVAIAIGVGAAASPFVALLLVAGAAVLWRERRAPDAIAMIAGAVASWSVLMVPALLSSADAWKASWKGYTHGADVGSLWLLVSQVANLELTVRTTLIGTGVLIVLASIAVVAVGASTRWSFSTLATLLVAVALIISPAAGPAFALVLLPLAVVAVRSWSRLLVWQACEIGHWALLGFYLGGILTPSGGGEARAYWLGVMLRIGGLAWLIHATVQAADESADLDAIEAGGGEPDPDLDVLTDVGHARA